MVVQLAQEHVDDIDAEGVLALHHWLLLQAEPMTLQLWIVQELFHRIDDSLGFLVGLVATLGVDQKQAFVH